MKLSLSVLLVVASAFSSLALATAPKSNLMLPNHSHRVADDGISYKAVCGKCGWVSRTVTSQTDANVMRADHGNAQEHYNYCSVMRYDSNETNHYLATCSKCNWESPVTTSNSDANVMRANHGNAQQHYNYCSVIKP